MGDRAGGILRVTGDARQVVVAVERQGARIERARRLARRRGEGGPGAARRYRHDGGRRVIEETASRQPMVPRYFRHGDDLGRAPRPVNDRRRADGTAMGRSPRRRLPLRLTGRHLNLPAGPFHGVMTDLAHIRNFAIIAHIDHGKSTLADRLIQLCGGLEEREMRAQVLDSMEIERERGITIKAQTVRLNYKAKNNESYVLNLMDTPGHVDFAYEVSRSLAACEGSLLVVDASQGVEAQTLANVYQAIEANHEIVPVLNKIDLPAAEPERIREQVEEVIGIDASQAVLISAKSGIGIADVLEAIVHQLPPPREGDAQKPLKAMLVDSWYDAYLGVIVLVRVIDGVLKKGQTIRMMGTGAKYLVERTGVFTPARIAVDELGPGEFGFITGSIKEVAFFFIDTATTE